MKHLGDITKLSGFEIPPVDVITGGSPCQDLSLAGKRAGLAGERSGLFMEQIRLVKEMRERDRQSANEYFRLHPRPRYMVWENVPGAFSSNKGADFQAVLTEIVKIAEPDACDVPMPEKGKWPHAGILYDEMGGWSVAWRVHDAQFWGVPQRRKRISVVADFGGLSASEVQFERQSMRGHFAESGAQREGTAARTEGGTDPSEPIPIDSMNALGRTNTEHTLGIGNPGDPSYTLSKSNSHGVACKSAISFQERAGKPGGGKGILIQNERVGALSTVNNQSVFCIQGNAIDRADTAGCNGKGWCEDVSYTLNTIDRPAVFAAGFKPEQGSEAYGLGYEEEKSPALTASHSPGVLCAVEDEDGVMIPIVLNDQGGSGINISENLVGALVAQDHGNHPIVFENHSRDSRYTGPLDVGQTVTATFGTGGNNQPLVVYDARGNGDGKIVPTLTGDHENRITDYTAVCIGNGQLNQISMKPVANTLDTMHDQQMIYIPDTGRALKAKGNCDFREDSETYVVTAVDCRNGTENPDVNGTLQAKEQGQNLNSNNVVRMGTVVRRLTPLECTRLQGYPDKWVDIGDWTDSKGKVHKESDSVKYKALGNSIALPFWFWLLRRIAAQYERPATLGSLFDGIGGFDYCWTKCNGTGTVLWNSEIESFPEAVTRKHFGDEETGEEGDVRKYL